MDFNSTEFYYKLTGSWLDWELLTLNVPLKDLSHFLSTWIEMFTKEHNSLSLCVGLVVSFVVQQSTCYLKPSLGRQLQLFCLIVLNLMCIAVLRGKQNMLKLIIKVQTGYNVEGTSQQLVKWPLLKTHINKKERSVKPSRIKYCYLATEKSFSIFQEWSCKEPCHNTTSKTCYTCQAYHHSRGQIFHLQLQALIKCIL